MKPVYECFEWDNTWIEHTENTASPRFLYIGDSISVGTRPAANAMAEGRLLFDHFGTSKALDNPYFFDSLTLFTAQTLPPKAVFFNNGHHGWHLDEETYAVLYAELLDKLVAKFGRVIPVLTTYSTSDLSPNHRVEARNAAVRRIAAERGLPVVDFYTVAYEHRDHLTDGIHLDGEGYRALAAELLRAAEELCP